MPKRLKSLISSFHTQKETGKAEAPINPAEDQKNTTTNATRLISSQPAIQPGQPNEILQPRGLWQAAYDELDEKQRQILSSI
ncbi:hypothetical protein N7486_009965 [Penicillium sp. IBT 16267x]|nr:hypothetical protein N7486_009965 [Penicillium sp. IBT 16267x]